MIAKNVTNFKLERSNDTVTTNGGILLFYQAIKSLGIENLLTSLLPKPGSNRGYGALNHALSYLFTLFAGGRSISDTKKIKDDDALKKIINIHVPSEHALGDWLRTVSAQGGIEALNEIIKTLFLFVLKASGLKKISIVCDPTLIKALKREAKMTYKGFKGYRPSMAFIPELDFIVAIFFKDGNDMSGRLLQLQTIINMIPADIEIEFVLLDSEYNQSDVINYLDEKKIVWFIAHDKNSAIRELIEKAQNWTPLVDKNGFKTNRETAEDVYCMSGCKRAYRIIFQRWSDGSNGYNYHCIATRNNIKNERFVILKYNERAAEENQIKELKNGCGMGKMPCGTLSANAVYFALGVLCYNVISAQKRLFLPPTFLSSTIKTLRYDLFEVPAAVFFKNGQLIIRIYTTREKFQIYQKNLEMRYGNTTTST